MIDIAKLQAQYDEAVAVINEDDKQREAGHSRTAEYDEWFCPSAYLYTCAELYKSCPELLQLARIGAAVVAAGIKPEAIEAGALTELIAAVKWFNDNPCDYPGGQDDRGLDQALYKLTGWQPDWRSHNRLTTEPHWTQTVEACYTEPCKQPNDSNIKEQGGNSI